MENHINIVDNKTNIPLIVDLIFDIISVYIIMDMMNIIVIKFFSLIEGYK